MERSGFFRAQATLKRLTLRGRPVECSKRYTMCQTYGFPVRRHRVIRGKSLYEEKQQLTEGFERVCVQF